MPKVDWKQAARQIRDHLKRHVVFMAERRPARRVNDNYASPAEFFLKNGSPFTPASRPKNVAKGAMQECYKNALTAVMDDPDNLIYVEGYAMAKQPVQHAWCANRQREAIEVTWEEGKAAGYWGVPISFEYIQKAISSRETYAAIDDWHNNWPVMFAAPEEWKVPADFFTIPAVILDSKVPWQGRVLSVQPRIRLTRSFDQRQHSYLGYVLFLEGTVDDEQRGFSIAVGKAAHAKHAFRVGDEVSGKSLPVEDPRMETAELYKTSRIKVTKRGPEASPSPPPFLGVPPESPTYRSRGHRRLATRTYASKCTSCIWGCRMPVEMIIDHWNPSQKRYRSETFCYGPKSCSFYRAGPKRKVPGRKGMVHLEEDWIDEDATSHRGADE